MLSSQIEIAQRYKNDKKLPGSVSGYIKAVVDRAVVDKAEETKDAFAAFLLYGRNAVGVSAMFRDKSYARDNGVYVRYGSKAKRAITAKIVRDNEECDDKCLKERIVKAQDDWRQMIHGNEDLEAIVAFAFGVMLTGTLKRWEANLAGKLYR